VIRKAYEDGSELFALPGGAQDTGEPLYLALDRECREEIGTSVRIEALLHVADWFKPMGGTPPTITHLVEFFFSCAIEVSYVPHNGHKPDRRQVEVVWLAQERLDELPLHPSLAQLNRVLGEKSDVYLGTIG